VKYSLLF